MLREDESKETMLKIMFVCLGNICRSPMAEYIFKDKIEKYHLNYTCFSRALSSWEEGNDIYPSAKEELRKHHIPYGRHYAKQINKQDYDEADVIYVMDNKNYERLKSMDKDHKVKMLYKEEIEDPYYTNNFQKAYELIEKGIEEIIKGDKDND